MSKKIISILIAAVLLISCFSAGFTALAANRAEADIPIIWITGGNNSLYNADGKKVYPVEEPDGYIMDAVKDCLPSFFNAIMLGQVDAYREKFLEWIAPLYTEVAPDKNGDNVNGIHIDQDMNTVWVNPNSGNCTLDRYAFSYDFRLDPYVSADSLANYIARVKAATGSDEVSLYARCEGATVLAAYLDIYGDSGIHKIATYSSAANGNESVSANFGGKININAEMGDVYASSSFIVGDEVLNEYFWQLWDALRNIYGLELTANLANRIYKRVLSKVIPDFLLCAYARFAGAWAMVSEADYQDALDYIFYNDSVKEEYKGLYEKITYYHDNAKANFADNLKNFKAKGNEIGIFCKYGFPELPLFKDCDDIGDGDIKLKYSSFGATTVKWGKTFSDKYIATAEANGTAKYISADRQVDASTCLFPDTTWFFKNLHHDNFPGSANTVIMTFFHSQGMTIDTYENYPQYFVFHKNDDSLVPMTDENCNTEAENVLEEAKPTNSGFFASIIKLFRVLKQIVSMLLNGEGFNLSFTIKRG